MTDKAFNIALQYNGIQYKGWVTASDNVNEKGNPRSFHVVLNETMFGNLAYDNEKWTVDEQRPAEMVEAVGQVIQENWNKPGIIE